MQTPICEFCAKTDTLCGNCEKKLKDGTLTKLDVDFIKYLYERHLSLDIEYVSSFAARDAVVLFFKGEVGAIVGRGGKSAMELSKKFGKRVKVINLNNDIKKVISDIIYPVTLMGINTVFTQEGEVSKIRLAKKEMMSIPFDISSLEKILFNLMQKRIRISFE